MAVAALAMIAALILVGNGVITVRGTLLGRPVGYWLKDILMIPIVYSVLHAVLPGLQGKAYGSFMAVALGAVAYQFIANFTGDWLLLLYRLGAMAVGGLVMWLFVKLLDL